MSLRGTAVIALGVVAAALAAAACDTSSSTCKYAPTPASFITINPTSELLRSEVLSGAPGVVEVMEPAPMTSAEGQIAFSAQSPAHAMGIKLVNAGYMESRSVAGDYEVGGSRQNFNRNQISAKIDGILHVSASGHVHLDQTGDTVTGVFEVRLVPADQLVTVANAGDVQGGRLLAGKLSGPIVEACSALAPDRGPASWMPDPDHRSKFCSELAGGR